MLNTSPNINFATFSTSPLLPTATSLSLLRLFSGIHQVFSQSHIVSPDTLSQTNIPKNLTLLVWIVLKVSTFLLSTSLLSISQPNSDTQYANSMLNLYCAVNLMVTLWHNANFIPERDQIPISGNIYNKMKHKLLFVTFYKKIAQA